ncbi:hypothetical protein TWF694_006011 [Orbilia ellipsospora]|uniref:Peptidase metallopeptidase domain-containing protein n=1 Tax=Orbilia ellipsospora TaxID=2528407 RepID=A0AAV9WT89_9PEZI
MGLACGHASLAPEGGLARRQASPDATQKWPEGFAFRWRLDGTIRGLDQATMEAGIARALQKWGNLSNFTYNKDNNNPNVTITIIKRDGEEPNFSNAFTLGYSGVGPDARSGQLTGYVRLNDTSTANNRWNPTLFHDMFLHEFGHVMGLGHAFDDNAIMAPAVRPLGGERPLTNTDINKFRNFYSGYAPPARVPSNNPQPTTTKPAPTQQPSPTPVRYPSQTQVQYPRPTTTAKYNNGYPTNPNYGRPTTTQQSNPQPTAGNRKVCDDAHTKCWQNIMQKRQMEGIKNLKRGNVMGRQNYNDYSAYEYNDPCRADWLTCMKQQGF